MITETRTLRENKNEWLLTLIRDLDSELCRLKFRVVVRRNFYDDQSCARLYVWNSSNGWLVFHEVGLDDLPCRTISVSGTRTEVEPLMLKSAEVMWDLALTHFEVPLKS